ncbi:MULTISPECIES: hypothetical protein [Mucilaginibacter]|uniref:hypothetical protein n=1 Tax=Mucilaginibacter TaxID=423349 RepID=UPI00166F3E90|nr:hypothetical protein [Mucilaginibacter rubeus]
MDSEFVFDYGDTKETFDERGYKVPVTRNVWVAGNNLAPVLIIVHSVMEAVAMLSLNFQRFSGLDNPGVVALGSRPCAAQINWINQVFPGRRVILVFGNDLVGRATDIKVASWLQQHHITITYRNEALNISRRGIDYSFEADQISLAAYKRALGIRNNISTCKPRLSNP